MVMGLCTSPRRLALRAAGAASRLALACVGYDELRDIGNSFGELESEKQMFVGRTLQKTPTAPET
jgi:hypothetical protein